MRKITFTMRTHLLKQLCMDISAIRRFIKGQTVGVLLLFLFLAFDAMPGVAFVKCNAVLGSINEGSKRQCARRDVYWSRNRACELRCNLITFCQGHCHSKSCLCFDDEDCPISCTAVWMFEGMDRQFGCLDYCECQIYTSHICNYDTSDCICKRRWRGPFCTESCPEVYECWEICRCMNNATCDHISGGCNCTAGYEGPYCEQKCPLGSHGYECSNICKCQNDAICHHVDGSCDCGPGWFGPVCAERCPDGYFGINCSGLCDCENNSTCSFVSGECNCADGFYGNTCEVQCFSKEWGKNRSQICDSYNGDCATNNETCLPGFHGVNCSKLDCGGDKWGQTCSNECNCKNGGLCHPITGTCCCKIPWTGEDCSVHRKGDFSNQSNEKTGVHSSVVVSAICIPFIILLFVVTGALFYRKISVGKRNSGTNSSKLRFSRLREIVD